ncbi:MAG: spermidine/putrescine ABC transporter substrate-binding protein [Eubacteriales bacterium]|nr:spermidine/putrescine ABC transporter substrate-binding protein [Eubacteriales bacterium]
MKRIFSIVLSLLLVLSTLSVLAEEVVNVYNWEDYINQKAIEMFQEETGIKVNYMNFTTNEDMMVQVRATPAAFDVVFPSDYCVERLIAENLLEELNFDNIPLAKENTLNWLQTPAYDKEGKYSVPFMWGTVGILYNTKMVDEPVDSWGLLWDQKYNNNVFMLDSIRDTLGLALKYCGFSMNTRDPIEIETAKQKLIEQKTSGMVKAYQVDETKDKMVANEAALAVVWSGDAQYAIDLNPDLAYSVPKEGSNVWVDAMVVPKGARNKENAEKFINFMCRPDIAKLNCEQIRYSSPNKAAIELMGSEYSDNKVMNPDQADIDNCEFFNDIQDFIQFYNAVWLEIKNAK